MMKIKYGPEFYMKRDAWGAPQYIYLDCGPTFDTDYGEVDVDFEFDPDAVEYVSWEGKITNPEDIVGKIIITDGDYPRDRVEDFRKLLVDYVKKNCLDELCEYYREIEEEQKKNDW